MAGAGAPPPAGGGSISVGPCGGTLLRLQLRNETAASLPVRDDFLSDVGGDVIAATGAPARREPAALRGAGGHSDQHRDEWKPVGCTVRLGAAAADGGRRFAPVRLSDTCRPY